MMKKLKVNRLLFCAISFAFMTASHAASAAVDADNDGLLEINNLNDLHEIRNDISGKRLWGSDEGCPTSGCNGWELTSDLDFDTNGNGYIDSGDWKGGRSWVPFDSMTDVVFEGNSHSISNLLSAVPVIRGNDYYWGLFSQMRYSTIKNLRLIKPIVLANTSLMPSDNYLNAGILVGYLWNTKLQNIVVSNATLSVDRPNVLTPLKNPGFVGGVVGLADSDDFERLWGVHFRGTVTVQNIISYLGGLAGLMDLTVVVESSAQGNLNYIGNMGWVGGIAGSATDSGIYTTYSTATVKGHIGGGVVGQGVNFSLERVYSTGSIRGDTEYLGGLVGMASGDVVLYSGYSTSIVNDNQVGLVGGYPGYIFNVGTYQVIDPNGKTLNTPAFGYSLPITQQALACASNPVDELCEDPYALSSWNEYLWDFGSSTELPVLRQNTQYPWTSVDRPVSGKGDYETVAAISARYPCDQPLDLQVKEKKSGYVFSVKTPEKFDFFNAVEGLQCTAGEQACNNYEVSYLCTVNGHSSWTQWASNTPTSTNPNETELPLLCNGGVNTGIRVRKKGETKEYWGAPQKPAKFSLDYGFACNNKDNGGGTSCKDYEARLVCSAKTLLTNP
jgi:Mucin-2 protein WxxW repeating region